MHDIEAQVDDLAPHNGKFGKLAYTIVLITIGLIVILFALGRAIDQ